MRTIVPAAILVLLLGGGSAARARPSGAEALDLEEWEGHIAELKRRAELDPANPNHLLRVAQAYSAIGDTRRVVDYTRKGEERGAHVAQAHMLLGDHYLTMHQFERALRSFDRALRVAPRNAGAWAKAWRALYELRRGGKTGDVDVGAFAADLQTRGYYFPVSWRDRGPVPREDPGEARQRAAAGYRLLDAGDVPGAVRAFRRALDNDPTFADAFRGLGIAHAREKHLEQALGAYTMFTELAEPGHRDIPKIRQIILDYYEATSRRRAGR